MCYRWTRQQILLEYLQIHTESPNTEEQAHGYNAACVNDAASTVLANAYNSFNWSRYNVKVKFTLFQCVSHCQLLGLGKHNQTGVTQPWFQRVNGHEIYADNILKNCWMCLLTNISWIFLFSLLVYHRLILCALPFVFCFACCLLFFTMSHSLRVCF